MTQKDIELSNSGEPGFFGGEDLVKISSLGTFETNQSNLQLFYSTCFGSCYDPYLS